MGLTSLGGGGARPTASNAPSVHVIDGLAVEANSLDLGELWEQSDYSHAFVIHNQNKKKYEILDFATSCSCLQTIEPRSLSIAPDALATVRLKLDLTKRTLAEVGQHKRAFHVEILPLGKESMPKPPGWRLHGIIKSRVTVDTLALDYGDEAVRGQPPRERKVMATVHVADTSLQARVVPDSATVRLHPAKDSSSRFELVITPRPTLSVGSFSCKLHLDLLTRNGDLLQGCILPISGQMQSEVRALPARLVFGPRRVGQIAEAMTTLQVPVGEEWVVDHIETESADVWVERVVRKELPLGQTFRVRQRVSKSGHQSSKVRFFVRKERNDPVPITMEVSYDGDEEGILSGASAKGDR